MTTPARAMLYRVQPNSVLFGLSPEGELLLDSSRPEYVPAWPLDAEGPAENLRNGLALLGAYRSLTPFGRSPEADEALKAVQRRIETALDQIEGKSV